MIRHLLKLVWNRKRSNALMILEICVSFLVVFVVATLGLFFLDNYRRPLGFEWKNVWNVRVGINHAGGDSGDSGSPEQAALFERLLREVQIVRGRGGRGRHGGDPFRPGGIWRQLDDRRQGRTDGAGRGHDGVRGRDGPEDGRRPLVPGSGFRAGLGADRHRPRAGAHGLWRRRSRRPAVRQTGARRASAPGDRRGERLPQIGRADAERQLHVPAHGSARTPRPDALQPPGPGAAGHAA